MGSDISPGNLNPEDITLGDVDGDGDLDLVVATLVQDDHLYLNNGTSDPFAGVVGIKITDELRTSESVALADMNRDGHLDLVAGGTIGTPSYLYLNRRSLDRVIDVMGNDISTEAHPTKSLAVGDIDRDGDPDLVAGNSGQPNRLYLNNGKLDSFEGVTGSDITSDARQTSAVALADLDKDGDLDLVAGNSGQTNRYYPNLGGPDPFADTNGSDISSDAHSTTSIALGDIDRDGDEDLVAGNFGQTDRLYLNNGTSDPWQGVIAEEITQDTHNTNSVALADIDRDGFLDLVAGNAGQPNRLYLNNSRKGFFDRGNKISSDEDNVFHAALGDLDGDEDLDLVVAVLDSVAGSRNRLYLNNGTDHPFAGVLGSDITSDVSRTVAVALGDVDGDGDLDLVTGNIGEFQQNVGFLGAPCRLYLNNGTSDPFAGVIGRDIGSALNETISVALGDLDGDRDLDLVEGNRDAPCLIYLNNGTLDPFEGAEGIALPGDVADTVSLALGDFDGDMDLDILAGKTSAPSPLYINNGAANPFSEGVAKSVNLRGYFAGAIAVGDIDRDQDLDVAVASPPNSGEDSTPRVYLNNGSSDPFAGVLGTFVLGEARESVAVALGDVDGDMDLDLVEGNTGSDNRLFLNNGTLDPFNGVLGKDIPQSSHSKYSISLGDLDKDGDLDLVEANDREFHRLYLNNTVSNPTFANGVDITADNHNTNSVALADVDVDGDFDVVAGNFNQPNRLYLNNGTEEPFLGATGSDAGVGVHNTEEVSFADLDRDGRPDLLTANLGQPNQVFLNIDTQLALPFEGIEGIDISEDSDNTRSLLAADMDRDGRLDLISGNDGGRNRLHAQHRFKTGPSVATSSTVDTHPGEIHRVLLEVEQDLPPNTSIEYWVSDSGGARWSLARPDRTSTLSLAGSDLRWRAILKSLSPRFSPIVDTLFLDLGPGIQVDPSSIDFGFRIPNTGSSASVTVSIVNEDEAALTISSVLLGGVHAGEFVFSNDTGEINLQPGGMRLFDVAFNPASLGEKTATVSIASDDIDRPNVEVRLRGVGGENPTPTATPTSEQTPTLTPTPVGTSYDIQPDPPDGHVDARDLLGWLEVLRDPNSDRTLLFDFARFWKTSVD